MKKPTDRDVSLDELRAMGVRVTVADGCYGIENSQAKQPVQWPSSRSSSEHARYLRGDFGRDGSRPAGRGQTSLSVATARRAKRVVKGFVDREKEKGGEKK